MKFEYKIVDAGSKTTFREQINIYSKDGWKLVQVVPYLYKQILGINGKQYLEADGFTVIFERPINE